MFPKPFKNDATVNISTHQAVHFNTSMKNEEVIKTIQKMGIDAFLQCDKVIGGYEYRYNDNRIVGLATIQHGASCCAFSKDSNQFYLYPIHEAELRGVGLTENDLLHYIKTLNDMKVGFNYLYFGRQPAPTRAVCWVRGANGLSAVDSKRYPTNEFLWIGAPRHLTETGVALPMCIQYLHWIYLRYLLNNMKSGGGSGFKNITTYAYYNIPRVFMHLINEFGLNPFRAFLYTCAAHQWYSGWGMTFSDYAAQDNYIPDLGVTKETFRKLLRIQPSENLLNRMLTTQNNSREVIAAGINLAPKHNPATSALLASEGKWLEFIQYMDKCYGKCSIPKEKRKQLEINFNGKKVRKTFSKRKVAVDK